MISRRPAVVSHPRPSFTITKRPKSKLAIFFWRRRIWLESTFALTVYEPWEKVIVGQSFFSFFFFPMTSMICVSNVVTIFVIISIAMLVGLLKYLPRHLIVMQRRAVYYLWGSEEDRMGTMKY